MNFPVNVQVPVTVAPFDAAGKPSPAKLSNVTFASSDPTVFTVATDPANPNGAIITTLKAGASASLASNATATEPDGVTTEQISGTVSIVVDAIAVPPAALLGFTFGTPVPVTPGP